MQKKLSLLLIAGAVLMSGCGAAKVSKEVVKDGTQSVTEAEKENIAPDSGTENGQAESRNGKEEDSQEAIKEAESQNEGTQAEEVKAPVTRTVTITATGDCTLASTQTLGYEGSFHQYYDNYGEEYFFKGVRGIFEDDDFTLINLECVLSTSEDRVDKKWNLKGKPEYVGVMTSSSIEGCSLGNNHSADYGPSSLTDTQKVLDDAGIIYGYNDHTATYTTDEGVVVGIVSANLLYQTEEYENYIKNGISALRDQGADIIIACCHWGIEREYYPSDYQTTTARKIVDWGADLVVGNHPHVLQGIEYYNGKIICYSLGNFCFGGNSNPSDKDTMLYQQTFTLVDGELQPQIDARIIPCTLSSSTGHNDYQPTIVEGEHKAKIINNMNEYSKSYSKIIFDEEGKLKVD